MVKFTEIEFKYRAEDIKLSDFKKAALALLPVKILDVSGFDHYFTNKDNDFLRYRAGDKPELTMKKKLKDSNNYIRIEVNLGLDRTISKEKQTDVVTKFCDQLGYSPNFSIFKSCSIYFYDTFNLVYYAVYDDNMKELDRFIEIEMDEEYPWSSDTQAWDALTEIEQKLKPLGISPQARIKRSLFEMFCK